MQARAQYCRVSRLRSTLALRRVRVPFRCGPVPFCCGRVPIRCGRVPFQCGPVPFCCGRVPIRCDRAPFRCGRGLLGLRSTVLRVKSAFRQGATQSPVPRFNSANVCCLYVTVCKPANHLQQLGLGIATLLVKYLACSATRVRIRTRALCRFAFVRLIFVHRLGFAETV